MASKLSAYPVLERRLRPIYDWLDNGQNKKALQEAEKVLRRQPSLQCARVLKCLALLRLGKEADCVEQLEAVRKEGPVEDATLQAMSVCYREIHKPQIICEMYKLANEKEPGNEETLTHLFFSYVRVADYNKQQQTAMSLYKLRPKNQYYFWAVMSNLLQTRESANEIMRYCLPPLFRDGEGDFEDKKPLDSSQNVCLRLSAKMMDRYLDKIESEQEVLLWFVIQEMQDKLEEALKALDGPFASKQQKISVLNRKVDLLLKLKRWEEAGGFLMTLISDHLDDRKYVQCYLDTVFRIVESSKETGSLHSVFDKTKQFLNENVQKNKECGPRLRGPLLARLEFYCQLKRRKYPASKIMGDIIPLMMEYMTEFGTADCCLHDLKSYIAYLSVEEGKDFLNQIWSLVSLGKDQLPEDKKIMHLHISNLELARCLRDVSTISVDESKTLVLSCLRYYIHSQSFNFGLPVTEPRSSDRYALLAAHVMYELWVETNNSNYLFDAMVICHYALCFSPSNSQFKLLLLKFYHLLGGCHGAQDEYVSLDIKHMQLDTLGYFHVFPLIAHGDFSNASEVFHNTLKFFTNNYKDSADHITYAYKYDAYIKIPEFIVIREKLNNSIHYMLVTLEKMFHDIYNCTSHSATTSLINDMEIPPHQDKMNWKKLQDNRDFKVIWELDQEENCLNKEIIEQTYNHDIVLLRLRSLLLRIIGGIVNIGSALRNDIDTEGDKHGNKNASDKNTSDCKNNCKYSLDFTKSTLVDLKKTLEDQLNDLNNNLPNGIPKRIIAAPPDSRLLLILEISYFDLILSELYFIIDLLSGENNSQEQCQLHLSSVVLYFEGLLSLISKGLTDEDNLKRINFLIQLSVLFLELVTFSCIVIGSCDIFLKYTKQTSAKKNKKKKGDSVDVPSTEWRFQLVEKLNDCIVESIGVVIKVLKSLEKKLNEKNVKLGSLVVSSKLPDKDQKVKFFQISGTVNETLSNSYISSVEQISMFLKRKLKYLSVIKQ